MDITIIINNTHANHTDIDVVPMHCYGTQTASCEEHQ